MPTWTRRIFLTGFWLLAAGILTIQSGCATAVQAGTSTALAGVDLIQMTDRMAASIMADADVQRAIDQNGPLKVVVQTVQNEMTGEVLPQGQAEAYTARVRSLLSNQARNQFTWVMNRDAFYRLRGRELNVDLGPAPEAVNPDYALEARFSSLINESHSGQSSYYLCVYQLTDLHTRAVLWTDKYEVKKRAARGFLD